MNNKIEISKFDAKLALQGLKSLYYSQCDWKIIRYNPFPQYGYAEESKKSKQFGSAIRYIEKQLNVNFVEDKFIKINYGIGNFKSEVYNPNDELIGIINTENEFHDLRAQIKEQQLEGYYLICRNYYGKNSDLIFDIDKNGRSDDWDDKYFENTTDSMRRLM